MNKAAIANFGHGMLDMKLGLRNKFLLPTALLIIIGMGITTVISYGASRSALEEAITYRMDQLVQSTEKSILSWIRNIELNVQNWRQEKVFRAAVIDSFIGKAARKSSDIKLQQIVENYGFFEGVHLASITGDIVSSSQSEMKGNLNIAGFDYFEEAAGGAQVISKVTKSETTGNPVFVVAAPLHEGDAVKGIFLAVVDLNHFSKDFIRSAKVGRTGYVYLLSGEGEVIAHPDESLVLNLKAAELEFGRKMVEQRTGSLIYNFDDVEKLCHFEETEETGWIIAATAPTEELYGTANRIRTVNIAVAACVVLLAVLITYLVAKSVASPIDNITTGLSEAAKQVASASDQMASSSQRMAEGASEQAASLEETSSSLEGMASKTRQNAANANQAETIVKEADSDIREATKMIKALTASMNEISGASEETQKIIKNIDEIAFQTNLLALNAAVEAARAGDAGAGFAVVADAVRSLAIRAAEAAGTTAVLIEGTRSKVSEGAQLVARTNDVFGKVQDGSMRIGVIIGEIAAASEEQAQGIEQINKAVSEMDRVIQQNAANAEETASASAEMNAQAQEVNAYATDLTGIVR